MSAAILFIGGPMDGKRMMVEQRRDEIVIPVRGPLEHGDGPLPLTLVSYRRVQLANSNAQVFDLFAPAGVDVIAALIEHYHPKEDGK